MEYVLHQHVLDEDNGGTVTSGEELDLNTEHGRRSSGGAPRSNDTPRLVAAMSETLKHEKFVFTGSRITIFPL